jgi:hypothetical protein
MVFMFNIKTLRVFAPMRERRVRSGSIFFCNRRVLRFRYGPRLRAYAAASRSINHDAAGPGGVSLR